MRLKTLLPPKAPVRSWSELRPRTTLHAVSVAILAVTLLGYLALWTGGLARTLFDPSLQGDDARIWLFPLHRWGPEGALADDPLAVELYRQLPPALKALYYPLVTNVGLLPAIKVVQGLGLLTVLAAGGVLLRARRGGFAPAALLVFGVAHTGFILGHFAGGFARTFGFPALILWIAGALARAPRARAAAICLGALFYPPAMLLLLGAEGIHAVRAGLDVRSPVTRLRLARWALLVATAGALLTPYMIAKRAAGSPPTYEQALATGAFLPGGRITELPFPAPIRQFAAAFAAPFVAVGHILEPSLPDSDRESGGVVAIGMLAVLLALGYLRLAQAPRVALAMLVSAIVLYLAARVLAFQLFSPSRYYDLGGPAAAIALLVGTLGMVAPRLRPPARATLRNLLVAAFMGMFVLIAGDGVQPHRGVGIDARDDAALHTFLGTLSPDIRIASHPLDGQNVPIFAARATTGNFETLQPWFVDAWHRHVRLATASLDALYATERRALLRFCRRHGITHLLLNSMRYQGDHRRNALSGHQQDRHGIFNQRAPDLFEPLRTWLWELLRTRPLETLVLADVPEHSVVFRDRRLHLVDVALLRAAWADGPAEGRAE